MSDKAAVTEGIFCALAAALLIGYAPAAARGAGEGLAACGKVILPAVFPFLALSSYAARSSAGEGAAHFLGGTAARCYSLPPCAALAVLMSWIGGYPAGPRVLAELSEQGEISREDAAYGACVCINSGPAFMAEVIGHQLFHSVWAGILLFLCQLAAGLITARLMALVFHRRRVSCFYAPSKKEKSAPPALTLVRSVSAAALTSVNICAFVILLSAFAEVLFSCGVFSMLSRGIAFATGGYVAGPAADCFLTGALEICAGSARALRLPAAEAARILPFLLSFGGCSVWCQVAACFGESGVPWGKMLLSRLLHGVFTALLAAPWLPKQVLLAMSGGPVLASDGIGMIWGCVWMLLLCVMVLLRCEKGRGESFDGGISKPHGL